VIRSALAAVAASTALLYAGAAQATTFQLLDLEDDQSEVTVTEPAAFTDPSPGHRRAALIDIDVFGSVDITTIELDCAARTFTVISETLHRSNGELVTDKTAQNQTGWRDIPPTSRLEQDRATICGWPQTRDGELEVHGPDFWTLTKKLVGMLKVPEGFFD
jgi:FlaA1/EpsC-like NDP-sugar epimerase